MDVPNLVKLVKEQGILINGGYGIIKLEDRSNRPEDIDYANGWENLWKNLLNPIEAIEAYRSGEILINDTTFNALKRDRLAFTVRMLTLKGIAGPITSYGWMTHDEH